MSRCRNRARIQDVRLEVEVLILVVEVSCCWNVRVRRGHPRPHRGVRCEHYHCLHQPMLTIRILLLSNVKHETYLDPYTSAPQSMMMMKKAYLSSPPRVDGPVFEDSKRAK